DVNVILQTLPHQVRRLFYLFREHASCAPFRFLHRRVEFRDSRLKLFLEFSRGLVQHNLVHRYQREQRIVGVHTDAVLSRHFSYEFLYFKQSILPHNKCSWSNCSNKSRWTTLRRCLLITVAVPFRIASSKVNLRAMTSSMSRPNVS